MYPASPQAKGATLVSVTSMPGCKLEALCDLAVVLPLVRWNLDPHVSRMAVREPQATYSILCCALKTVRRPQQQNMTTELPQLVPRAGAGAVPLRPGASDVHRHPDAVWRHRRHRLDEGTRHASSAAATIAQTPQSGPPWHAVLGRNQYSWAKGLTT